MSENLRALETAYEAALRAYLVGGGEAALSRAYEIGRMALVHRVPIVGLTDVHHAVLVTIGAASAELERAAVFLAEVLSPYEMTQRGFRDANARLEEVNRSLREKNEALDRAVAKADSANRELEAFSYSVSHDLRAPLRAIAGFSQAILEDHAPTLDPKAGEYLARVCAAAKRMGELIDDLLQLSRVGRAELRRARVGVSDLVRAVAADLSLANPKRSVELVVPPGLVADADPRLLRVLFENLLGNAWKFTSKVAAPRVEVGTEPAEGDVVWFVRDNGAGFDARYADRLFAPFQRLHSEDEFAGTGIGLATVRRIVDRHGGRVWAEGEIGRGATIRFTLPAPQDEP